MILREKPKIENNLIKQRNNLISFTSFLSIGLTILSVQNLGLIGTTLSGSLTLILGLECYNFNKMIKSNQQYKRNANLFARPFLKKGFNNWLKKYIESSDNLIEKKYKAIFIGLWLNQRKLKFETFLDYNTEYLQKLSTELIDKKITNFSILSLTKENTYLTNTSISKSSLYTQNQNKTKLYDFIEEDFNNQEFLNIGKRIYQEYAINGFATKFLNNNLDNFLACMFFQDYKLNDIDYENISHILNLKNLDPNWEMNSNLFKMNFYFLEEKQINCWQKIINNENSIVKLDLLKKYLDIQIKDYIDISNSILPPTGVQTIMNFVENKINYINMEKSLTTKEKNKKDKIKKL